MLAAQARRSPHSALPITQQSAVRVWELAALQAVGRRRMSEPKEMQPGPQRSRSHNHMAHLSSEEFDGGVSTGDGQRQQLWQHSCSKAGQQKHFLLPDAALRRCRPSLLTALKRAEKKLLWRILPLNLALMFVNYIDRSVKPVSCSWGAAICEHSSPPGSGPLVQLLLRPHRIFPCCNAGQIWHLRQCRCMRWAAALNARHACHAGSRRCR